MTLKRGQVCRLCLNTICPGTCEEITDIMTEIFEVLLVILNLSVSRERAICKSCSERLQKSFDFKLMCLFAYDRIFPFINNEDKLELDLRVLYMKNTKTVCIPKEQEVCKLCMELISDQLFHTLKSAEEMVKKYMPELDSRITNFVLCTSCTDSLKDYSCFVEQCLLTEEKVKKYCEVRKQKKRGEVCLKSVAEFSPVKVEDIYTEEISVKTEIKDGSLSLECPEKIIVKSEFNETHIKTEIVEFLDVQKVEPREYKTCRYVRRKLPQNRPRIGFRTEKQTFICAICDYQNDIRKMFVRHMFVHKNLPITEFDCHLCDYKTKRKCRLDGHLKTHEKPPKKTYKCEICKYEVRFECMLKPHMLTHMDPAQLNLFPCKLCSYKCKFKTGLVQHMRKHIANKVYKCEKCEFKSNYEESMKRHRVFHLDPAIRPKFKCASCEFEAYKKSTLHTHIRRAHTDPSKVPMHKCDQCKFKSFYKSDYKRHMLKHKDPSELITYNCQHCDYSTICKKLLTGHQHHHKDQSEVKMYKCGKCPYVTRNKGDLVRKHALKHVDPSEAVMFKCLKCDFSSKYKSNLRAHIRKYH